MNVLQQAHDTLEQARGTISHMQQCQPHIDYCNEVLYGDIAAVKTALSKAIAQGDLLHAVQEHGATIKRINLGHLQIENRTAPGRPSTWAVCDGFGSYLSKSGELVDEPQPSSRTYEWLQEHHWPSAKEAIKAVAKYLVKEGGAA